MVSNRAVPACGGEPEKSRQFVTAETGGDADVAIVAAHGVGADGEAKGGETGLENAGAPRFASDDDAGVLVETCADFAEGRRGEVMEKQVGADERVVGPSVEGGDIGVVPRERRRPIGRGRRDVERVKTVGARYLAITGAEVEPLGVSG